MPVATPDNIPGRSYFHTCTAQVSSWMAPGGKLFVHIFVHATMPYHFEVRWLLSGQR